MLLPVQPDRLLQLANLSFRLQQLLDSAYSTGNNGQTKRHRFGKYKTE